VNNFSNRLRLRQSPWEDWLKHVAKNDEGEGDGFCERICPKKSEKSREEKDKSFTCIRRDVDLTNTNRKPGNVGDAPRNGEPCFLHH